MTLLHHLNLDKFGFQMFKVKDFFRFYLWVSNEKEWSFN